MTLANSKVKKKKKNIPVGIVHIKSTFNNTIVTFSDLKRNVVAQYTAGRYGFKGPKKSTPYAAQITTDEASKIAKEHGFKTVSIEVKGAGMQRESAIREIFNQGFVVTHISDVSPVAHNGVRPPKKRRV